MGMQVHFSLVDVLHAGCKVTIVKEAPLEGYPDSWVVRIADQFTVSMLDTTPSLVTDIGSWSPIQQKIIEFLIKHRISFSAN